MSNFPANQVIRTNQAVSDLGPWFHNIHLPDGIQTAPNHTLGDFPLFVWTKLAPHLPDNLKGWQILDVGCNAGFYCVELAKRGAFVTGIDMDPHYLAQARWVAQQFGLEKQIKLRRMQVYDLAHHSQKFDLILFMGVFYHLRYPLLGLDIVAQKVRGLLVFQTMLLPGDEIYAETADLELRNRAAMREPGWPKMAFLEHHFADDPTNWWICNRAGAEALLRSSGLKVVGRPDREMYLCEPNPTHPACITNWNIAEFLAATGQERQDETLFSNRSNHG